MRRNGDRQSWCDAARKTIKHLQDMGADQVEAFCLATRTTEVTIRNSEIFGENEVDDVGVSFRATTPDKRVGFACTNIVNTEKDVLEAGKKALSIARLSPSLSDFTLPLKLKIPTAHGLFDEAVVDAKVEDAVDVACRLIKSIEDVDRRVTAKAGQVSFSYARRLVVNSFRVNAESEETRVFAYVYGSGSQGAEITPSCLDFEMKRTLDLDPENIGRTVSRLVLSQFNPKPVDSFEGTVIFEPNAVSNQLFEALSNALNGENVVAGSSPWTGKLNETVASETLNVADNGLLEGGFASRDFDDEGFPSQSTDVITRGKLNSFLLDATSANKLKMPNTGNASRFAEQSDMASQIIGGGYKAKPTVHPSNLTIMPGRKTKDGLIAEVDRGVLVGEMGGFIQAGSGLISAQLMRAHYIKDGTLQYPIKGAMISGVAFDWFKQIDAVANDLKQSFNSVVPSIRIRNVKIIGSR